MASYTDARIRLFSKFDGMKPGQKLTIEKEANGRPDLYIQLCKEYIDEHPDFEFNSELTKFRRLSFNPFLC